MDYLLAQVNIARLRAPLDSPVLADFVAAIDPVEALAAFVYSGAVYSGAHLRAHGPTPHAFTLRVHCPPPGRTGQAPRPGRSDWMCPA